MNNNRVASRWHRSQTINVTGNPSSECRTVKATMKLSSASHGIFRSHREGRSGEAPDENYAMRLHRRLHTSQWLIYAMYPRLRFGVALGVPKCISSHGDAHHTITWSMYAHRPYVCHSQGSTARVSVFNVLLTSRDDLEIDPDNNVQHHPRRASDRPVSVGS